MAGGPSPCHIPMLRVGSGNAPHILAIIRKLLAQLDAPAPMNLGGRDGIQEIVREFVALVTKIEPGLRELMHEQRRKRSNIAHAVVFEGSAFPRSPCFGAQGMRPMIPARASTSSSVRCNRPSGMPKSRLPDSIHGSTKWCLPRANSSRHGRKSGRPIERPRDAGSARGKPEPHTAEAPYRRTKPRNRTSALRSPHWRSGRKIPDG